jgi:hypothetical protein
LEKAYTRLILSKGKRAGMLALKQVFLAEITQRKGFDYGV